MRPELPIGSQIISMTRTGVSAAHIEPVRDHGEILPLLVQCGSPVSDISPANPPLFFGIGSGSRLMAIVGLERFPSTGLLRSLAVSPRRRGNGHARTLVAHAEGLAASRGVESMFLLTSSESGFFGHLGYAPASRATAPAAMQATQQFSTLCPASSAFLCKSLKAPSNPSLAGE